MQNFNTIYTTFLPMVKQLAKATSVPPSDKPMLVQDTFLRVNRSLDKGTFPTDEERQRHAILRLFSYSKKSYWTRGQGKLTQRDISLSEEIDVNETEHYTRPKDVEELDIMRGQLAEAMPLVSQAYQQVLKMAIDGSTTQSIAQQLGIAQRVAQNRLDRARLKIREVIQAMQAREAAIAG